MKLKNLIKKTSINEAKEVKLPKGIYVGNEGRGGNYVLEFGLENPNRSYTPGELGGIGRDLLETLRKNNGKLGVTSEGKVQVIVREGHIVVQIPFKSKLEREELSAAVGGKMTPTF